MSKIVSLCIGILVLSIAASAQDLPKFDAFAGYSYIHFGIHDPGGTINSNLNGGVGSVAFYPGKWLGIVADFGGYKMSKLTGSGIGGPNSIDVDGTVFTYLFGPRVRFGSRAVTPFGQALFGGAHVGDITSSTPVVCQPLATPCTIGNSENAFAMTLEGGIDLKLSNHFAIRGQGGYLMTRFNEDQVNGGQARAAQNNARVAVGIVIR